MSYISNTQDTYNNVNWLEQLAENRGTSSPLFHTFVCLLRLLLFFFTLLAGLFYYSVQKLKKALLLYKAENGDNNAMNSLAKCFENGIGTEKNLKEVYKSSRK